MPLDVPVPMLTFLKNVCQKSASVQEGMIYGKTNTVETNFLKRMFVRVIRKATVPPKRMAMHEEVRETASVLSSGP